MNASQKKKFILLNKNYIWIEIIPKQHYTLVKKNSKYTNNLTFS